MSLAALQDTLVLALNVASMLAMGLTLTPAQLRTALGRAGPTGIGLAVNLLGAPLLGGLLVAAFGLPPGLALGFLLCAAAPGGNVGPLLASGARGDVPYAVALVVVLSFASVATVPVVMGLLAGRASADFAAQVPAMVGLILTWQIAPLLLGMTLHAVQPRLALRAAPALRALSMACLVLVTIALTLRHGGLLLRGGWAPLVAIELFVLLALASGLLIGGPRDATARALALTTCTRNFVLSLLLASTVFRAEPAVAMGVLVYGFLWLVTAVGAVVVLRRFPAEGRA